MWTALACLCIAAGHVRAQADSWEVQIDQGPLRGHKESDGDLYIFWDVPYATAPSGSNKFKAPLPGPAWTETFDAVYRDISCTQPVTLSPASPPINTDTMFDDCLVANIFVPEANATNLSVMVYVHGGVYHRSSGNRNPLTHLARTQGVIVITFNYRLGVQGFLCLGTEDVPGNAGMKDQVAMLRWIKRNIASFGGNPNDVTLAGCSAGGGGVDILTLSPMTAGLFNKVITQSGSCFAYTGVQIDPIQNAKTFARMANFTNVDNIYALEEFYKTASSEIFDGIPMTDKGAIYFSPCVERDTGTGEEIFLPDSPLSILKKGQYLELPTLYGYADMEGLFYMAHLNTLSDMSQNFSNYLPFDLRFNSAEEMEEVARTVREYYFGEGELNENDSVLGFVDYYSDIMYLHPMLKGLKLRREANKDTVYLYEYSFTDSNTAFVPNTDVRGASHCAQVTAIRDEDITNASEEYIQMKAKIREIWGNFIKFGVPVPSNYSFPEWPPVNDIWTPHMIINSDSALNETNLLGGRTQIWEDIYERYYNEPSAPVPGSATSLVHSIVLITGALITKFSI